MQVDFEQVELATLSGLELKLREREIAQKERKRKSLRERKRYTRKPGHVHPKKKEATKRRKYKRKWETDPYSCFVNGYGMYKVDKALWAKYISPLWELHLPEQLEIKKYPRPYGTRVKPHTIYSFDVVHRESRAILYSGNSQEIYDLSSL